MRTESGLIKNISYQGQELFEMDIVSFDEIKNKNELNHYCRSDYYQIIWISEGCADFEIDMKSVKICTDDYLFIGKDMIYKFDSSAQYKGYLINFTEYFFCRSEQDISFLQNAAIFNQFSSTISGHLNVNVEADSLKYIIDRFNNKNMLLREDILHTHLKLFLFYAESEYSKEAEYSTQNSAQNQVKDFKHLLNESFIEHKEVSFYSEKLGLSSKQLQVATKQVLGKNPKEVIIEKVVLEAKRFLTYSGYSVKQIAYCLGFNEPNNFSVFFQKYTGQTPGSFKKT